MKSIFYCLPLEVKKLQPVNLKNVDFNYLCIVKLRKQENKEIVKDFIKLHRD